MQGELPKKPAMARPAKQVTAANPDRRSQIAAVAADLFAEFGYEATTVRQIADRVGMLAGSLYNHFATKDDMLHAIMRQRMAQFEQSNTQIANLPVDAEHRLLANAIMRIHDYVRFSQFHTILLRDNYFFQRHPDFTYIVAAKSRIRLSQESVLRQGMEAGLFRPDMDCYLMIGTISRMLSGVSDWYRSIEAFSSNKPAPYTLDVLVDFHFDCLLRLVRLPARMAEPVPRAECEQLIANMLI
ncbi:MAG: hypothetical protein RLY97_2123 [Pseudomonadota bacterium]